MFRCIASNTRLIPLCKKQPNLLLRTKLNSLQQPFFRRSFTTGQICRRQGKEELKEQVATATTTKKKTESGEIKKLFRLAKPESKSIAGR